MPCRDFVRASIMILIAGLPLLASAQQRGNLDDLTRTSKALGSAPCFGCRSARQSGATLRTLKHSEIDSARAQTAIYNACLALQKMAPQSVPWTREQIRVAADVLRAGREADFGLSLLDCIGGHLLRHAEQLKTEYKNYSYPEYREMTDDLEIKLASLRESFVKAEGRSKSLSGLKTK